MWEIVVDVIFEKIEESGTGSASRRESIQFPAGRIPTSAVICDAARNRLIEFLSQLYNTIGNRPYEYGDMQQCNVKSVTWVPK